MGKEPSQDYDVTPEELTGLRNAASKSVKGCCECVYRKDGIHKKTKKLNQLKADGKSYNGQTDNNWKAEIIIDSQTADKKVHVRTRMLMKNETANTSAYPGTIEITDSDLETKVAKISPAIAKAWNARPYKLKITDKKCGEREFKVAFDPSIVRSGSHHYAVNFINVKMGTNRDDYLGTSVDRSWVVSGNGGKYIAKFNVNDKRSATDLVPPGVLEAHEYGHMLGLKDEYHDVAKDRGGMEYTFHDGTKETVGTNKEIMGQMGITKAKPERYCLTVAYAVIAILAQNGCPVSKMEIL